jgi:hypothetical protein
MAAAKVADRALEIKARHEKSESMIERFKSLGDAVRRSISSIPQLKKTEDEEFPPADKVVLLKSIPTIEGELDELINEAAKLRADSAALRMKELEQNADSLTQSLQSARRKLSNVVRP